MSGSLRNSGGNKVMVCLVNTALIVGRQVSRPGIGKVVQEYREPIPTTNLVCTDLADGEGGEARQLPPSIHQPKHEQERLPLE